MIFRFLFLVLAVSSLTSYAGTYAQFRTFWGDIDVELYDNDKPVTVQNFLRYVQSGRFNNMFFHRCPTNQVTGVTDFVVQGGGFFASTNGIERIETFGEIPNEFGVGRRFSNLYGTIAMAKVGGDTNSANSQFFFNLNNNTFLDAANADGFFTVFGRIIGARSTNVLNMYLFRRLNDGVKNLQGQLGPEFITLPVTYSGTRAPTLADLEYADISVLKLSVAATNGTRELSWNSLSTNHVYHLEFTTDLTPQWQTLVSTNGIGMNGQTMRITDSSASAPRRFYRVRIGL